MEYRRRILDSLLDELFDDLSAISIEGAKGVGKTATASRRASTVLTLSEPRTRESVAGNFDLIAEVESPVFVDEWQLEPQVWERVRQAVDANPTASGQFLLAGSAGAPPGARTHSGAGRIVSLVMRPMAMSERGVETPTVSLSEISSGKATIGGRSRCTVRTYTEEILRSGFPGLRDTPTRGRNRQLDAYLARIVDHEMPENGIMVRHPAALRAWLRAYAAATSTTSNYTTILNAATAGESDKPSRPTVTTYREQLQRLYLLDPVEAWIPTFSPLKRLTQAPKHHLVDPALAARLVGVGIEGLLTGEGDRVSAKTGTWLGALFESLVVQSVRVYSELLNARVGHLRTKGGDHEIDIIVEAEDLSCTAIEVKLSDSINDSDVKHLHWLKEQMGDRLRDQVIINTGEFAYRRKDGIAVVPLALLGP